MAFSTEWHVHAGEFDDRRSSADARPQRLFGGAALACVVFASAWFLWSHLAATGTDQIANQAWDTRSAPSPAANAYAKLATSLNARAKLAAALTAYARRAAALKSYAALFDSRWLGFAPASFVKTAFLEAAAPSPAGSQATGETPQAGASTSSRADRVAQGAVAPAPIHVPPTRTASLRDGTHPNRPVVDAPAERPSIFERLFGKPSPLTLAYAAPDDAGLSDGQSVIAGRYDRSTAVYDISAHTVYMPDGTRLEAHSGLGASLDDPRHVAERMRGPTPPNVYDLKLREAPFHGVQALRLIPVDEEKVFGRSGLLAHTFMLGANGQSNGCVSFRNYNAFLQAYLRHEIKRLVVVARLD